MIKRTIAIVLIVGAVFLGVFCGVNSWLVCRDTSAILERAQVAANMEDMLSYTTLLEANMQARGMTTGYAALVFKSPANDMDLIYKTLTRVNERILALKDIPTSDVTYQVALDDLRGTLRELDIHAAAWFFAHEGCGLLLICIACCAGAFLIW
jgi:hypothetical protein